VLIATRQLFRLIAERENRLRRGNTRHARPCRSACKRNQRIDDSAIELTGARWAFKHAVSARPRLAVESLPRIYEKPTASVMAGLIAIAGYPDRLAISGGQPHEASRKIAGRRRFADWSAWRAAASYRHGERIVPTFIDRGAPAEALNRPHFNKN
jgi:hypothetical protein